VPGGGDMHFYDQWARQILEKGHETSHLAFYGLPGYAWLLAFLYAVVGYNATAPALLQSFLDAGTAALIYKISCRLFDSVDRRLAATTGILAALGWCFFVPAQTYCAILMPTACAVFAFWFVIWVIVCDAQAPSKTTAVLLGLLIGLSATAVATILCVLPLVAAAILLKPPRSTRTALLALLVLGVTVGTAPCWIHNCVVARDRVFLSAHSGINFWIGNNAEATGYPRIPPGLRAGQAAMLQDSIEVAETAAGHPLKRGEVSSFWAAKAWKYIHLNFTDWMRLLGVKAKNFWNAFQYDDLSIVTSLREEGVTFPGIYFGFVAALGIPGLALAWRMAPSSRWIAAAIGLHFLALLPVFVTERYRLPVVPGLLIFASFGLASFARNLAAQNFRPATVYAGLLLPCTLFVSWPQRDPALWALDAYNVGRQALESGNLPLAERKLNIALAYVRHNAETHFALGNLNLAQQHATQAAQCYLETLALDAHHRGALNNLGVMALESDQPQLAEDHFRHALALDNHNPKLHFLLAKSLLAQGKRDNALCEIQTALALNPSQREFLVFRRDVVAAAPR
jgi:hypothetical protein